MGASCVVWLVVSKDSCSYVCAKKWRPLNPHPPRAGSTRTSWCRRTSVHPTSRSTTTRYAKPYGYTGAYLKEYTEKALRDRHNEEFACRDYDDGYDPYWAGPGPHPCRCGGACVLSCSAAENERHYRDWARCELARVSLKEPVTERSLKRAKDALIAEYGPIEEWDVSKVTDMSYLFGEETAFDGDLSKWDVSNVTNMSGIFCGNRVFNGDMSKWDVSNVTNMGEMFAGAVAFNGDLSTWNVSNVTNMYELFCCAHAFNGDLSAWDVSKVTNMVYMFLLHIPSTVT